MRQILSLRVLPLLVLTALAACGSPRVWVESTSALELSQDLKLDTEPLVAIACETHNGAIKISGDPAVQAVDVEVKMRVGGYDEADADRAKKAVRIIQERRGDTLYLSWKWTQTPDNNWGASVSFSIESPANLAVKTESHNGAIRILGMKAPVRAVTHNGRIRIEGVTDTAYAHSHNGRIEVTGSPEDLDVHTHNGRVSVATTAGVVRGSVSTHNGSVTVDLAEAASTRLNCSTHNGGITTDLPLSKIALGRRYLRGTIGEGGGELRIVTYNGSIRLR